MSIEKIMQAITVTAELTGTELSTAAKVAMAEELAGYALPVVLDALQRCRRELKGRLTFGDVVSRLDDGRPGVEEAWALYPKDESASAAVTTEMHLAMSPAWPLIQEGERVGARMAFKESYERIVAQNRAAGIPVKWEMTFGFEVSGREGALADAVQRKRIGVDHALKLLPRGNHESFLLSVSAHDHPLLAAPKQDVEANKKKLSDILASLTDETKVQK